MSLAFDVPVPGSRPLRPRCGMLFWAVFSVFFVGGGALVFVVGSGFRMAYVALLVLALIPIYGLKIDGIVAVLGALFGVVLLSALLNGSSARDVALFMRFLLIPFAMVHLARQYLTPTTIQQVLRIAIALGMLQLPIVVVQRVFYHQLAARAAAEVAQVDFDFGTFFWKDDPALSFFLIGLILFLLFDERNNGFVRHKGFKTAWLALTVLTVNSLILQIALALVLLAYVLRRVSPAVLLRVAALGIVVFSAFAASGYLEQFTSQLTTVVTSSNVLRVSRQARQAFLQGRYSRAAAVAYYATEPPKLIGDGPSRYYDPVNRSYSLGNTGHVFTFYGELGAIGLFLSYVLLYAMTRDRARTSAPVGRLYFMVICMLSVTTSVLTDASILLAYNIFLNTHLLSSNPDARAS